MEANSQLQKEELDVERAISRIAEVQVCMILSHCFVLLSHYRLFAKH